MKRVSVKFEEDRVEELDSIAEDDGVSRSELIRNMVDDSLNTEGDERVQELEERNTELETKVERLEKQNLLILEQRNEYTELVEYVEKEQSLSERKAQAGILTRAKWLVSGMDGKES